MHYRMISIVSLAAALVACTEPAERQASSAAPVASAPASPAATPREPSVDETRCELVTPYFAYDRVQPLFPQGDLARMAACLGRNVGDMETITLVGRTDARGSEAYNERLGLMRAEHVRGLLVQHGLPSEQIVTRSAGERGAMGFDDGHIHADDRRVDILPPDERVTRN